MNKNTQAAGILAIALLAAGGCGSLWRGYLEPLPSTAEQCQMSLCETGSKGGSCEPDETGHWHTCERPNCTTQRAFDFICPGAVTDGGSTVDGGSAPDMSSPMPPTIGMSGVGVASYGSGTSKLICAPSQGPIKFAAGTLNVDWSSTPCTWLLASDPQVARIVRINLIAGENPALYYLDPATVVLADTTSKPLKMSSSYWHWLNATAPRATQILSNANRASGGMPLNFRVFDAASLADKVCTSAAAGGCDMP